MSGSLSAVAVLPVRFWEVSNGLYAAVVAIIDTVSVENRPYSKKR